LALILKNSSGSGISRPDFKEIGTRVTPEVLEEVRGAQPLVSEEVTTEKRIGRIRKKQKDGCGKLTLTLKQLKTKGNYSGSLLM
jgi:hypothetical protein